MLQIPGESYPDALSPLTVEEQQLARDLEGDVKEIAPEPHKLPFPIPILVFDPSNQEVVTWIH
ncbi:hypothetical protein [Roseofilum sp. Belize Diploria]|nr:hypothetical protein [Roseofilum sp. Belize Diploria]MBP0009530.1 hypothetical protein [Roseofilum sp. Belize Diploria]